MPFLPFLSLAALAVTQDTHAEKILEGFTVLKGKTFAFELHAPRGWVLDNETGNEQGLNVIFYPKDSSWDQSAAVCYARVRTLDAKTQTIEDQVRETLGVKREKGGAKVEARYLKTLTTQDASKAKFYVFTKDHSGNLEATAYIQGTRAIAFITLSAKDEASLQSAFPALDSIVTSYEDLTKPSSEH